jgi:hypothetical protein
MIAGRFEELRRAAKTIILHAIEEHGEKTGISAATVCAVFRSVAAECAAFCRMIDRDEIAEEFRDEMDATENG